jgi:hypothetical protein
MNSLVWVAVSMFRTALDDVVYVKPALGDDDNANCIWREPCQPSNLNKHDHN